MLQNGQTNYTRGFLYSNCLIYFLIIMFFGILVSLFQETQITCIMKTTPKIRNFLTNEELYITNREYNDLVQISRKIPSDFNLKNECVLCNVSYTEDTVSCVDIMDCRLFKNKYRWCDRTYFRK